MVLTQQKLLWSKVLSDKSVVEGGGRWNYSDFLNRIYISVLNTAINLCPVQNEIFHVSKKYMIW